jgi:protein SCO1/2
MTNRVHRAWAAAALALCAASAAAQASDEAAARAVAELARLNGQALACRDTQAAQRAKSLMLTYTPKTPRYSSLYEEGTQASFLAQLAAPGSCPQPALLLAGLTAAGQRLQLATAGLGHAPLPDVGDGASATTLTPRYLLQGPGGRAVTSEDFRGRFQLVAFGFVSCPDVCPTTMLEMQQVLAAMGERARLVQPIFISVDPQRDTLQVLEAYTQAFDQRILGLTGQDALVKRAADNFRVRYQKVQEPGARPDVYTIEHTAGLFLLGPDGLLAERIPYGTPVAEIVARVQQWLTAERK